MGTIIQRKGDTLMGSVLKELVSRVDDAEEKRATAVKGLDALSSSLRGENGTDRDLTDEEEARSAELLATIDEADKDLDNLEKRLKEENKREKRTRRLNEARGLLEPAPEGVEVGAVHSVREPMVYGKDSPYSYTSDFVRWYGGPAWPGHEAAGKRLSEWAHQVEREIALDPETKASQGAFEQIREAIRENYGDNRSAMSAELKEVRQRGRSALDDKPELRAIGTDGGASASAPGEGSAFVTPAFWVNQYAPYREVGRAFADACNQQQLPPYGMNIYLPQVTGGAEVGELTESAGSTAVSEKAITAGYIEGGVKTFAGEMVVSQQLLDRAGPNFAFDQLVFDQLNRNYALRWDKYVLNRALSSPQKQNWSGNSQAFVFTEKGKAGGFVGQINKAQAAIREKAGTVLNPTAVFLTPGRYSYISAYADEYGRLLVNSDYQGAYAAAAAGGSGNPGIEGATGLTLGGLPVYQDANIPGVGTITNDQVIVGCLSEVWCFEGNLVPRVIPQTKAQNLQVILQLYAYGVGIVRYPEGIVTIEGTALKAPSYTN